MKCFVTIFAAFFLLAAPVSAAEDAFSVSSPNGTITVNINAAATLTYAIVFNGQEVLSPSPLAITLTDGTTWGAACKVKKCTTQSLDNALPTPFTRKSTMSDRCNELVLQCNDYNVEFRAYDDGVAYRFVSKKKKPFEIKNETIKYCFDEDYTVTLPYIRSYKEGQTTIEEQFFNSFENLYTTTTLSQLDPKRLSFLPIMVDLGAKGKICITETALDSYPGFYLYADGTSLCGIQAPYPKEVHQGGYNNLQYVVDTREDYIAKIPGTRPLPWRIVMIGTQDIDLANNDLSYILAAPSRVDDITWIKPGKVAWEWWNDCNLRGVDFRAGVNNDTYKYYIDFAAANGVEYILLDEGWAVTGEADLTKVVPEIDIQEICDYANARNVGVILWAGCYAFDRDMENVVKYFASLGVKGFKIDFMDRDDQWMTEFYYRAADTCARYKMICDFHGAFKPSGLTITYPNVLNLEGVAGLEQMKWINPACDQMKYDCQIPFIRQTAGPIDYTQGAMHNTIKGEYTPNYSKPMSQGTRCHQLALYVVIDSPLCMLCDTPIYYTAEGECTSLITAMPTTWDDTRVLCGEMGEYVVTARRKGTTWYIGGITSWDERDIQFTLPEEINATGVGDIFCDGINADRNAEDYKHCTIPLQRTMNIHLAPGGGFVLKIDQNK